MFGEIENYWENVVNKVHGKTFIGRTCLKKIGELFSMNIEIVKTLKF